MPGDNIKMVVTLIQPIAMVRVCASRARGRQNRRRRRRRQNIG